MTVSESLAPTPAAVPVAAPTRRAQGGYFSFACPAYAYITHSPLLADVVRDDPPESLLALRADGHAREALVGATWSALLGVSPLSDDLLAAVDAAIADGPKPERTVATLLAAAGVDAVWVPECDRSVESKRRREVVTMAAMRAGVPFIWNARLPAVDGRISEPDFLVRSRYKRMSYWPGDVKDAKTHDGKASPTDVKVSQMASPLLESASLMVVDEGKPKLKHSLQLAHYFVHLQSLGFAPPARQAWGAILGREDVLVWRDLAVESHRHLDAITGSRRPMSPLEIYQQGWDYRQLVVANAEDPSAPPMVQPVKCADCPTCEFRTFCHDDMLERDDISLLQGMSAAQAAVHYDAGVRRRSAMAYLHYATAVALDAGVDVASLLVAAAAAPDPEAPASSLVSSKALARRLADAGLVKVRDVAGLDPYTAQLYAGRKVSNLARSIDAALVVKAGKVFVKRGVKALEVPQFDIELDVDMENDPGGIIYLWGTRVSLPSPRKIPWLSDGEYRGFSTFSPGDDDGEAQAFAGLWSFMGTLALLAALTNKTFGAWCYTDAEARCMRSLAAKHEGFPGVPSADEVEALLASPAWVDLYRVVSSSTVWPTEDLKLKTVAKWVRHSWRDSDPSGDASTVWYRRASSDPDPLERMESQRRILEYNEDDVAATAAVRTWLRKLAKPRRNGKVRVDPVTSLGQRFGRRGHTTPPPV
jgi:hypothetical protein